MMHQLHNITAKTKFGTPWQEEACMLWQAIKKKFRDQLDPRVITTLDHRKNTTGAVWGMLQKINSLKKSAIKEKSKITKTKQKN